MKPQHTLPDTQNMKDTRGIAIPKVGVNHVMMPVRFDPDDSTIADTSLYVDLAADVRGANMSRLVEVLALLAHKEPDLPKYLDEVRERTGCSFAYIRVEFPFCYLSEQHSRLVPKVYPILLEGTLKPDGVAYYDLTVTVPYISTCPCSQAMILSSEEPGAPHMQRATARVTLRSLTNCFTSDDAERLIQQIEEVVRPTPFPLLKRPAELEMAYKCWEGARFVEDSVRDLHQMLDVWAKDFLVVVESEESIHQHNAMAISYKGVEGGLR